MTIVWHVDDIKVSYKNLREVTKIAIWLSSIYREIKVQWGKIQNYLRMTLGCTKQGEVQISMIPYIEEKLEDFPERIDDTAISLVAYHLFTIMFGCGSQKTPGRTSNSFSLQCC